MDRFAGRNLDTPETQYWASASVKYGPSPTTRWFPTYDSSIPLPPFNFCLSNSLLPRPQGG